VVELSLGNFLIGGRKMPDLKTKKNKHLTGDDRQEIMECLDKDMTFKAIALRVSKDPTTVSKEIKKHLQVKTDEAALKDQRCPKLLKSPFVCNPCDKRRRKCGFQKQFYIAKRAHAEYEALLSEAREGIPLSKEVFWEADAIIAEGIKKGQRLYHIMETHDVGFSKSTAYRHLHKGYLSAHQLDFPRVAKFKARKQYKADSVPKAVKVGRTYDEFVTFVDNHNVKSWVEMVTIIGRQGGKVIMTFDFTFCNFMFGLLLDNKTADEAASKIRALKRTMKTAEICFGDIIPVLLTDNGGEFSNVFAFIENLDGEHETNLFFCDPYRACQKPKVEKNHTLFRDIVPKGNSFDNFTQDIVNEIFSHVNSIKRKVLNGKTPYEMFAFVYEYVIPTIFGIQEIPAAKVIQSPKLLKALSKPCTVADSHINDGDSL
jgi:IS30 family transposase